MTADETHIVAGQGVLINEHNFLTEFPEDQSLYINAAKYASHHIPTDSVPVLSGGYSQYSAPHLSEGASYRKLFPAHTVVVDDFALCSGTNVISGLMAHRLYLDGIIGDNQSLLTSGHNCSCHILTGAPIRSVIFWIALKMKTLRFALALEALGIEKYTIAGFADNCRLSHGNAAARGEALLLESLRDDPLMLYTHKKRIDRFAGNAKCYLNGYIKLAEFFPNTVDALLRADYETLRMAFREEVLHG